MLNLADKAARAQTPRPGLSWSGMNPGQYLADQFDTDLRRITSGMEGPRLQLSVASFCPDWPRARHFAEPAKTFQSLADSLWFLCAFFVTQLIDQASHCTLGSVPRSRAGTQGELVLVGLLASHGSVMSPAFLLLVLSLYKRPMPTERVMHGLTAMLRAELEQLAVDSRHKASIVSAARSAMMPSAMPESLRAFVPRGDNYWLTPDPIVVNTLREEISRVLVEAETFLP